MLQVHSQNYNNVLHFQRIRKFAKNQLKKNIFGALLTTHDRSEHFRAAGKVAKIALNHNQLNLQIVKLV